MLNSAREVLWGHDTHASDAMKLFMSRRKMLGMRGLSKLGGRKEVGLFGEIYGMTTEAMTRFSFLYKLHRDGVCCALLMRGKILRIGIEGFFKDEGYPSIFGLIPSLPISHVLPLHCTKVNQNHSCRSRHIDRPSSLHLLTSIGHHRAVNEFPSPFLSCSCLLSGKGESPFPLLPSPRDRNQRHKVIKEVT